MTVISLQISYSKSDNVWPVFGLSAFPFTPYDLILLSRKVIFEKVNLYYLSLLIKSLQCISISLRVSINICTICTSCHMIWPLPPFLTYFIPCSLVLTLVFLSTWNMSVFFPSCLAFRCAISPSWEVCFPTSKIFACVKTSLQDSPGWL